MVVHILTHAVVEADTSVDIYSVVAEHIEVVRQHGSIKSMTIQHGDWKWGDEEVSIEVNENEGLAWLSIGDQGQTIAMLRRLAMRALAAAQQLERSDDH